MSTDNICVFDPMPISAFVDMPDGSEHLVVYVSYLPIFEALLSDDDVTAVRVCEAAEELVKKVFVPSEGTEVPALSSCCHDAFTLLEHAVDFEHLIESVQAAFVKAQVRQRISEADYENALGETFAVMVKELEQEAKGALSTLSEAFFSERTMSERDVHHLADAFRSSMGSDTADLTARRIQQLLGETAARTVNGQYLSVYGLMNELTALYDELDEMNIEEEHHEHH